MRFDAGPLMVTVGPNKDLSLPSAPARGPTACASSAQVALKFAEDGRYDSMGDVRRLLRRANIFLPTWCRIWCISLSLKRRVPFEKLWHVQHESQASMSSGPPGRIPPLTLVSGSSPPPTDEGNDQSRVPHAAIPDVDWSILMARAQGGDSVAYRRLLTEITPFLRAFAVRRHMDPSDAQDVAQDVLLTVHAIRHTYDPTRPFGPWLVAIAHRRFVDRLRRQGRTRSRETVLTPEHETFSVPPTNYEEARERQALEKAVATLSPGQQTAIRLLKIKELSLKEAAAASGMSIAALKVATHRALKKLRQLLADRSNDT
ncbi:MAG TPA: sigma-70 family RNA polymerase sigma factor [Candidatus Binataceae bacterium]|nr:sigma-70 family RNA polymerase sigma factor [Candidatus Binataceae bacterium]